MNRFIRIVKLFKINKIIPKTLRNFLKIKIFSSLLEVDRTGYGNLIDMIKDYKVLELEGDFCEIGAYMGGGTKKLSKLAKKYHKNVYTIDNFFNNLGKNSIYSFYKLSISGCKNVITIIKDTKKVKFSNRKFVFGFIDGDHSYEYVVNDFHLIWPQLVSGGIVTFHDISQPDVKRALSDLYKQHKSEIREGKKVFFKNLHFFGRRRDYVEGIAVFWKK